ncbi:hypothetical protein TUBRATIS_000260 [Tubulinosema ratisbonensis]|uniref:Uncharacterized protein n=1 Tax=Tubulinosema ratisbonensis TaxID=291195 RepID=A0A437AQP6_9MICR|nr:hypothetical protein TUBRATIS_000260 [Tubulinosema ratisbonensis]
MTSETLKNQKIKFIEESDKKYDKVKKIVNLQNKKEKNSIYFDNEIKHNHLLDFLNSENRGKTTVLKGKISALIKLISNLLKYMQEEYHNDEFISKLGDIKSSLENYKREIILRLNYSLEEKQKKWFIQ